MKRLVALLVLCLVAAGALATSPKLRTAAIGSLRALAEPLFGRGESTVPQFDAFYAGMVEALPPQQRAERALELAINRYTGAPEYVLAQAQSWRGGIKRTRTLETLIETAINAPLLEVRMAGYELHLAQFDLDKTPEQVDQLLERMARDPRGTGPWALWNMAMIGARGVDRERIYTELMAAMRVDDELVRRWAVDSFARFGGSETIEPLLAMARDDRSALIRERAFCGLAKTGMLHIAERYDAVPGLLRIAEDPQSDAQNRGWAYQALREITSIYDLPDEPAAWHARLVQAELLGNG